MAILPLRDAFQSRKNRCHLLDRGIERAGWHGTQQKLLEVGCANGGAAAHLAETEAFDLISVDIDEMVIRAAEEEHPQCCFLCADACALPFSTGCFDGIFSEAAFSVIREKQIAAAEYARVLKPGGKVLLNDFFLREARGAAQSRRSGIPCVDGVRTLAEYDRIFQNAGFRQIFHKEYYFELLSIAESLSKVYAVENNRVGSFLREQFGGNMFVEDFFSQSGISYAQMLYEKETDGADL